MGLWSVSTAIPALYQVGTYNPSSSMCIFCIYKETRIYTLPTNKRSIRQSVFALTATGDSASRHEFNLPSQRSNFPCHCKETMSTISKQNIKTCYKLQEMSINCQLQRITTTKTKLSTSHVLYLLIM